MALFSANSVQVRSPSDLQQAWECPTERARTERGARGRARPLIPSLHCLRTLPCWKRLSVRIGGCGGTHGAGTDATLVSNVTAAVPAHSRPSTVAPVVTVMEAKARMFPLNTEPVPNVAELPTCQKTLAALAPPLRITWRPEVVVSVDPI